MSDVSFTGILPAINRNFPNVIATNSSGVIAYGSRTNIYFIDVRTNPPLVLDSKFISNAHKGRIIGLSFSKNGETELLASISDDHQLKVWDTATQKCLFNTEIRECTRAVQWTYDPSPTLLYTLEAKFMTKFNFKLGTKSKIKLGLDIMVSAIECHPKLHEIAAVAHYNGTINIINVLQEEIQQTFKMHSMEITSLAWSPFSPFNLLSSSIDLTIRVWKVGEQKPIFTHYCPTSRVKMEDKKKMRILAVFHPVKPNTLIFTSPRGDVTELQYLDESKFKVSRYFMGNEFIKLPFSLFFVANSAERKNLLVCTDIFKIVLIDIDKLEVSGHIPFLMHFIFDITISSVNPSLMAVCNGDGIMKVWNTQTKGFRINMTNIFLFYKAKILTAAWHPVEENILAFGTGEGRVGIIDLYKKKILNHFETHHTDSVYSLCWAPCKKYVDEGNEGTSYLYSCGGGIIYIHKLHSFKTGSMNFNDLAQWPEENAATEKGWSEIQWKPDFSLLCLGTYKGFMEIFNKNLIFLACINLPMKTVESLCWHPEKTYMSPNGSPLKSWFSCAGNDLDILIFDSNTIVENTENGDLNRSSEPLKKLIGHKKRVVSLCWSPHNDNFLASASKDSSALVWDVSTGTIISSFLNHRDVVLAVQWSPFDKDIVYSGGQDNCLRGWKISECGVSSIPDKVQAQKKMKTIKFDPLAASFGFKSLETDSENCNKSIEDAELESLKSNKDGTISVEDEEADDLNLQSLKNLSGLLGNTKKSLFPDHGYQKTLHNVNDCARLADILSLNNSSTDSEKSINLTESEMMTDEDVMKFGPYLDQLTALRMLQIRGEELKLKDKNSFMHLGIMAGNIEQTLEYLAEKGALSSFLVSLAPSVSYSFWLSMCEAYAKQLLAEKLHNAASSYYLICGKVHEAVNILAAKGSFVDALVLAKARLPASDPLIRDITYKLMKKQSRLMNKIPEAECYLAMNEPLTAAKTLAADPSPNSTRVAAHICRKFNYVNEADDLALCSLEKCLINCSSSGFELLVKEDPKMQIYEAFFACYIAFHEQQLLYKNKTMPVESLLLEHADEVKIWNGATCTDKGVAFIEHVNGILSSVEQFNHEEMLGALKTFSEKRKISPTTQQYIAAMIHITEFIHLCHLKEVDSALNKFQYIFHSVNDCKYLPKILCFILLPIGLQWNAASGTLMCKSLVCENTPYEVDIYKNFLNNFIENINSLQYAAIKSSTIIQEELELCLEYVIERICGILSKKKLEDSVLTYFSTYLLDSIEKAMTKIKEFPCLIHSKKLRRKDIQNGVEHHPEAKMDGEISESKSECDISIQLQENDKLDMKEDDKKIGLSEDNCKSQTDLTSSTEIIPPVSENLANIEQNNSSKDMSAVISAENPNSASCEDRFDCNQQNGIDLVNGTHFESTLLEACGKGDSIDIILTENKVQTKLKNMENEEKCVNLSDAEVLLKNNDISLTDTMDEGSKFTNGENLELSLIKVSEDSMTNTSQVDESEEVEVVDEENHLSPSQHSQCVNKFEIFYHLLKFITLNICKDEYALLYYLKRQVDDMKSTLASEVLTKASKETKTKSQGKNQKQNLEPKHSKDLLDSSSEEIISGKQESDASESIEKESIEDLLERSSEEIIPGKQESDASESIEKESIEDLLERCSEEIIPGKQESDASESIEKESIEDLLERNSEEIISGKQESNASESIEKESTEEIISGKQELERSESIEKESTENLDDSIKIEMNGTVESIEELNLTKGEHENDNIDCDLKQDVIENICEQEMPAELTNLIHLISSLENTQVYYPNPLDAVLKILTITDHVLKVVECHSVQDKLHEFVHEVLFWANKYSPAEKVLTCKKCLEKN